MNPQQQIQTMLVMTDTIKAAGWLIMLQLAAAGVLAYLSCRIAVAVWRWAREEFWKKVSDEVFNRNYWRYQRPAEVIPDTRVPRKK